MTAVFAKGVRTFSMLPLEINSIAERTILTIEKPGVAVNALRFAKGLRGGSGLEIEETV